MREIALGLCLWAGILFANAPLYAAEGDGIARKLEALNWYSEEFPPYNYMGRDGTIKGMAVDILMAGLKRVGANVTRENIKIVPWKDGYRMVQRTEGTVLFSTAYTPERQQIMNFVGPSVPIRVSIIAPKDKNYVIKTAADLGLLKIGVVRDDIGDQLIRKFALSDENIAKKDSLKQLSYFFERGRVDAIAYVSNVYAHHLKQLGQDPNQYEEIYLLKEGNVGYAFHNSTPSEVLSQLQTAIDGLHADGTIKEIIARYVK